MTPPTDEARAIFLPDMPDSGVAVAERSADDGGMKKSRLPRPYCRAIEPDADEKGYYCTRCGYDLIETKTGWYRHGNEWRHPEAWR